jgi:DNA transformation protein
MLSSAFKDFVLDQLSAVPGVACRAMFGGFGLYRGAAFFGIIYQGRFYLKTDQGTCGEFLARGSKPFEYKPGMVMEKYLEVPVEVLENRAELAEWVQRAAAIPSGRKPVRAAAKKKTGREPRSGGRPPGKATKRR